MRASLSSSGVVEPKAHNPAWRRGAARLVPVGLAASAELILVTVLLTSPTIPAKAGNEPRSGQDVPTQISTGRSDFTIEIHGTLKKHRDQMIRLAEEVLGALEAPDRLKDQIRKQQIAIRSAEANLQNARLTREVAEIAVTEYKEGIYVQDLAVAEGEIKLARDGLERARKNIELAKDRLATILRLAKNSAGDLSLEYMYTDRVELAQLEERKAALALEQAESNKRILVEYTRGKRLRELQSEVEKARSQELTKKAECELARAMNDKMGNEIKKHTPTENEKGILFRLRQAFSIDEQVRTRLEQFAKNAKPDASLQKEIQDLTNQLQAVVAQAIQLRDQVQSERAEARFADLKFRITREASGYSSPKQK
jgi:hypothetical protein